jgi:hypothetical protein
VLLTVGVPETSPRGEEMKGGFQTSCVARKSVSSHGKILMHLGKNWEDWETYSRREAHMKARMKGLGLLADMAEGGR